MAEFYALTKPLLHSPTLMLLLFQSFKGMFRQRRSLSTQQLLVLKTFLDKLLWNCVAFQAKRMQNVHTFSRDLVRQVWVTSDRD